MKRTHAQSRRSLPSLEIHFKAPSCLKSQRIEDNKPEQGRDDLRFCFPLFLFWAWFSLTRKDQHRPTTSFVQICILDKVMIIQNEVLESQLRCQSLIYRSNLLLNMSKSRPGTSKMKQCHATGKVERMQIRSSDFILSRLWSAADYHFQFENASRDSSSSTTNTNDFDRTARTSSASFPPFSRSRLRL